MKNILITGVSSGIGYATAQYLLEKGYFVFGSVRKQADADKLTQTFGAQFKALVFDVRDSGAIKAAVPIVTEMVGHSGLAGLINNAGIAVYGPLKHLDFSEWEKQMDVNVSGVIRVTQAFLPLLGAAKESVFPPGKIINISSVSALFTTPMLVPYCTSKKALEAVTEGLRRELLMYGIDVVSIQPGPIKTPIWDKTNLAENTFPGTDYEPMMLAMHKFVAKAEQKALAPEKISQLIFDVLVGKKKKTKYVITGNPWPMRLIRLLPARMVDRIFMKQFSKD